MPATVKRDYYEILGVDRGADPRDIKKAYRKIAMEYHPDRNGAPEAEEIFKEASEAYAILSDPEKRSRYDRFGHQGVGGSGGFDASQFTDFADIFEDLFGFGDLFGGGRRRGNRARRGSDIRFDLQIDFEEAVFGKEADIEVARTIRCDHCEGTGAEKGSSPVVCNTCGGQGQIRHSQGFFAVARTCPQCGGAGRVIKDPCSDCSGSGRLRMVDTVSVRIPPGVDTGTRLRISGGGDAGLNGGPPGDLYVFIDVNPHPELIRRDYDIHSEKIVSFTQAALGAEVEIATVHGPQTLEIPAGAQPSSKYVLKGKGVPYVDGRGNGDHWVHLQVHVPTSLSAEQREIIEQLARVEGEVPRPKSSLFSRIRDMLS